MNDKYVRDALVIRRDKIYEIPVYIIANDTQANSVKFSLCATIFLL